MYPRTDEEAARLDDPGRLEGWNLSVHAPTFALSPVGFAAQTDFSLETYSDTTLEELKAAEPQDPRFWWQRR